MSKKVLLVGSGGREHAFADAFSRSPQLGKLYITLGNPGTSSLGENLSIKAGDIKGLVKFAFREKIDLTFVGPDDPLKEGVVDVFASLGLRVFGPKKLPAEIEWSKAFAKRLMVENDIPTANFIVSRNYERASNFVSNNRMPLVVKASGLAFGKGVYVCRKPEEALLALNQIMIERVHGDSNTEVVIEDFVPGQEVSIHAFSDGNSFSLFPPSRDHKPVLDGDRGPNGGGSGTIARVPDFTVLDWNQSHDIVKKILEALKKQGRPFIGCIYPGLKMSPNGWKVLEVNARAGDPETQCYMRLLKTDLITICDACIDGRLDQVKVEWDSDYAACIVLMSDGYGYLSPNLKIGFPITGIEEAEKIPGVKVFHAGTKVVDGVLVNSGGRVLNVTAKKPTLKEALDVAYAAVRLINFEGKRYRKDIGASSLS